MTYFIKQGNSFTVTDNASIDIRQQLPAATYIVKFNEFRNEYYLDQTTNFDMPAKLYENIQGKANRIINSFNDRLHNTGVLLIGEKGSGKTLLAKQLSLSLISKNIPTLIITNSFSGTSFNQFISSIEQECLIFIDEFEKLYNTDKQDALLTLLDGTVFTKKLFVLTANGYRTINEAMINRPGRIYYKFDYNGLSIDFVKEYCNDNLKNLEHLDSLAKLPLVFNPLNFDTLQSIIEEMNRYDEPVGEVLKYLNATPETYSSSYNVTAFIDGVEIPQANLRDFGAYNIDILSSDTWEFDYKIYDETNTEFQWSDDYYISREDIVDVDCNTQTVTYELDIDLDNKACKLKLVCSKLVKKAFSLF